MSPSSTDGEFADFVHARSASLHRAAYLMVGEPALAQDLVQEALVKTYAAWPRIRDKSRAEAYCRKAITTTAIGWFRRRRWTHERPVATLPEPPVGGHDAGVTQSQWLWTALQTLPARQRISIVLRYYDDLTEAQTADAMGCSVGTVKSQVSTGLARLRDALGDDDPDLLPQLTTTVTR
jgi:RNA polymerase sigma-70 factor (sigma-E family)